MTRAEHATAMRAVYSKHRAAGHVLDEKTKDASRLWFFGVRRNDDYQAIWQDGEPLDVDDILAVATADTSDVMPDTDIPQEWESIDDGWARTSCAPSPPSTRAWSARRSMRRTRTPSPNASWARCDVSYSNTFEFSASRTCDGLSPSSRASTTRLTRTKLWPSSSPSLERRRCKAASRRFAAWRVGGDHVDAHGQAVDARCRGSVELGDARP